MMSVADPVILSVVVPFFNESGGLEKFTADLIELLDAHFAKAYEIICVNDGSTDDSLVKLKQIVAGEPKVKILSLSRNFGKEIAITAGINSAVGAAILTIDGDDQHPMEYIPEFVKKWREGSKVVVGLRTSNTNEGWVKKAGSTLFYWLVGRLTHAQLEKGATDFRLIDRSVQAEFRRMTERGRITRGLIDWLGYKRDYVHFKAKARNAGKATYSFSKLLVLAIDSFISLSISPLYVVFYAGLLIVPVSALLGALMVGNQMLGDPLQFNAKGTAYIAVLLLFLVGLILVSQGIIGLYLSHIHTETQNRPLYVVDSENSIGLHDS